MAENSKIQWTDATWNIARGCTKVDEDCKFCYMYRGSYEGTRYDPYKVIKTKSVFTLPLKIKAPSKIFTSSLTDVFHPAIDEFRDEMWNIIRKCPHHTFQILTKRPERILECLPKDWGNGWQNVWLGTSIGSQSSIHRIKDLVKVGAKVRFLSIEPLHGPMDITTKGTNDVYNFPTRWIGGVGIEWIDPGDKYIGLHWVIIGGESGNEKGKYRYRPCNLEWIENLVSQCKYSNVPVFVKQLGTHLSKELGLKDRHGGNIDEWPEHLRIREFPND